MSESVDPGQDPGAADAVEQRETAEGVTVRKVARLHDAGAVAIYFTFKSARADRCRVRVRDPLPAELRFSTIEFHPHYDPENWYETDDASVYEAPLVPEGERMTAYGVVIDDPRQLELFDVSPEVEVESTGEGPATDDGATALADGAAVPAEGDATTGGDDGFAFGKATVEPSADPSATPDDRAASAEEAPGDGDATTAADATPARPRRDPGTNGEDAGGAEAATAGPDAAATSPPTGPGAGAVRGDGDVADELVAALERREQTAEWRQDLRMALGLERDGPSEARVTALREQVEALEARVAELESTVEREARWRDQLRRQLGAEPGD